jgi:hypothetical protein
VVEAQAAGVDLVLDDGAAVIVKWGVGPRVAELRAEGARLARAAHPGVVSVLRSAGDEATWELHLAHGGRPLSLLRPTTAEQVAELVAATAAIVADLHDQGTVHGRLSSSHVLVGPGNRVRLCGLGPGTTASPADDVAALGALLVELLGDREELEPLPERRWHRPRGWSGVARRSLLTIADQAAAEPASRRPSARRLAASIVAAVPSAGLQPSAPSGSGVQDSSSPSRRPTELAGPTAAQGRHRRGPAASLVGALAGTLVIGIAVLRMGSATDPVQPPASARALCVRVPGATAPCADPVVVDGTTVRAGSSRFEVGQTGDVVALGDWDCDGGATPAVLRPSTGEVFVFPAWAGEADVRVPARARVSGAMRLLAVPDPERSGCTVLVAEGDGGVRSQVPVGAGS